MKNLLKLSFVFFIATILFSSCQKELGDMYYIYAGSWGSETYSIEIWENGRGVWEKKNGVNPINATGHGIAASAGIYEGRVEISGSEIKFNAGILWSKKFHIDTEPTIDATSGRTYMVLDGENFYKH